MVHVAVGPHPPAAGEDMSWPAAFLADRRVRAATFFTVLTGLLHSVSVGYVSAYLALHREAADCGIRTSAAACADAVHANDCVWLAPNGTCAFSDWATVQCGSAGLGTRDACKAQSGCVWDSRDDECEHVLGYAAWEKGLVAAGHTSGGLVGPMTANLLLARTQRFRVAMAAVAAVFCAGLALHAVARATLVFPLLILGRFLVGVGSTANRFLGPLYAFRVCPLRVAQQVAGFLEPVMHMGLLVHVAYAFGVDPRSYDADPAMELRVQFLLVPGVVFLAMYGALCVYIPEPEGPPEPAATNASFESVEHAGTLAGLPSLTLGALRYFALGLFVSAPFLLTGLGPMISFMTTYGRDIYGIPNFAAPFIISAVAVPAGCLGVLMRRWFPARPVMLAGTAAAGVSLVLIGAASYPGAMGAPLRYVAAVTGIVCFVSALHSCVGPTFFELAIRIMPPHLVGLGSSFLSMSLSLYSLLTNLLFPLCVEAMSGGPDEDQNRGYALSAFVFAGVAAVCFGVLFLFMFPYDDGSTLRRVADKGESHEPAAE